MLRVQVLMAWPHRFQARQVELEDGATVADALGMAAFEAMDEIAGQAIFGVAVSADARLRDGDRIELLRSLQLDPKEARRRRAAARVDKPAR